MDCSQHKKEVAGISDMKVLAEMIGDLHYETLTTFLKMLGNKIDSDGFNDFLDDRIKLSQQLRDCATNIKSASYHMAKAWQISKPFMEPKK